MYLDTDSLPVLPRDKQCGYACAVSLDPYTPTCGIVLTLQHAARIQVSPSYGTPGIPG